jgi:hypothetical protein
LGPRLRGESFPAMPGTTYLRGRRSVAPVRIVVFPVPFDAPRHLPLFQICRQVILLPSYNFLTRPP